MNILRNRDPSVSISLVSDNQIIKNALRGNRIQEPQRVIPPELSISISPNEPLPCTRIKRNYSCSKCTFFTQNPRTHLYHYRDVHGDKGNIYECNFCIYASKHAQKLQRHVRMCHTSDNDNGDGDEQEDQCDRNEDQEDATGSTSDEFEGEQSEEEPQENPKIESTKFQCKTCDYSTQDKTRYKKHVKHHDLSSTVACTICDFSTPYKWNLDRHLKNHTTKSSIQCPICSFSADNKQSVSVHIQSHHLNLSDVEVVELVAKISAKIEEVDSIEKMDEGNSESLPILFDERTGMLADNSSRSFINPEDILEKNGKIYFKKLKCSKPGCGFRAVWETELNRHMSRAHSVSPKRLMPTLEPVSPAKVKEVSPKTSPVKTVLPKIAKAKAKLNYPRNRSSFLDNLSQRLQKAAKAQVRTKTALKGLELSRLARKSSITTDTPPAVKNEDPKPEKEEKLWDDMTGTEIAPGIGLIQTVHHKNADASEFTQMTRRVFKCPHQNCKFWASTPARFHVHIIDHSGTKPFHCSSCAYSSNWSWDVTKHIRLKGVKDSGHQEARVVETEIGENYKDYGKYVDFIKIVLGEDDGVARKSRSPSVTPTPQQNANAIPKMPKLIRAPDHAFANGNGNLTNSQIHGQQLPALKQIRSSSSIEGRTFVEKNMLSGGEMVVGQAQTAPVSRLEAAIRNANFNANSFQSSLPPLKRPKLSNGEETTKRWKCKMCAFGNEDKAAVVAHIRKFHKKDTSAHNNGHGSSVSIFPTTMVPNGRSQTNKQKAVIEETHQYTLDQDKYNCKFCPFKSDYLQYMLAHSENHFSKAGHNFSCQSCSFSVATESELTDHVALHNIPSPNHAIRPEETPPRPPGSGTHKKYHCTECPYVTDSRGQFQYHRQFHVTRADSPFKCEFCTYCVSHKHLLHQHSRVHSKAGEELEGRQSVSPRNESDSENKNAKSTETTHPSILMWRDGVAFKVYRCHSCPQIFEEIKDLVEHENSHGYEEEEQQQQQQQQQQQKPKPKQLPPKNNIPPKNNLQPKINLPPKNNLPLSTCRYCPARFFNTQDLVTHTSFHRIKSQFKCTKCTYSVKSEKHLESHTKVHGLEYQKKTVEFSLKSNKIKCPKCPARLPNEPSFQQHYGFHGKDFGFNCTSCDFGADSANALMLHGFVHEIMNERKSGNAAAPVDPSYAANIIKQRRKIYKEDEACEGNPEFNYPTYVKNGKMKEKRYKCKKCPSAFEKRDQYNVHMGLHGSEQRYKCSICDYSVTYYANFSQHLKKHQSQPEIPKELLDALATPISKLAAFRCTQCPFFSNSQSDVEIHEGQHGRTSPGLVHCQFCDFAVGDHRSLDRHIKFHFQNSEPDQSSLYGNEEFGQNDEDDEGQTEENFVDMLKRLPIDMYEDEDEEEEEGMDE